MYLEKILADDNVTDTGGRKLFSKKLTGGERALPVELTTGEGGVLFRVDEPVVAGGKVDLAALRAKVERPKLAFLELLAEHAASRIAVSMNSKAGNYAPTAFVDWEGAKGKSRTVRIAVHKQAMLDLIKGSRVES